MFALFNGVTIAPFVTADEGTVEPKTWYRRIFVKSGLASNPEMFVPNAAARASNAALSGAKTVNVALGFFQATSNPSRIKAASK